MWEIYSFFLDLCTNFFDVNSSNKNILNFFGGWNYMTRQNHFKQYVDN